MLGSHTKQINAYGKRSKRVIDDRRETAKVSETGEIVSIFEDLPPPPEWKSVVARMKKRENDAPPKSSSTKPTKVVGLQKKKRLLSALSPSRKKLAPRPIGLVDQETVQKAESTDSQTKQKSLANGFSTTRKFSAGTRARSPLSSVALNILSTVSSSRTSRRFVNHDLIKSKNQFSPFIDVDIFVIDDCGRPVRKEKRVTCKDVNLNPQYHVSGLPNAFNHIPTSPTQSNAEQAFMQQSRPLTRQVTRQHRFALSDGSDSEFHDLGPADEVHVHAKSTSHSTSRVTRAAAHSKVEVLIPPLPYKVTNKPPISDIDIEESIDSSSLVAHRNSRVEALHSKPPLANAGAPTRSRYQHNDSPIQKPRQLTPIRGDRRGLYNPPSPSISTDFDISADFFDLSLGLECVSQGTYYNDFDAPDYLLPLLHECHQETCGPYNFSAFIESFRYDPILQSSHINESVDLNFRKIGEASYSEVFGIGDVVLKVIPLRDESSSTQGYSQEDGPAPSDAKDVRKEIIVTRAMGEIHPCFVKLLKAYVVKGKYPEILLKLWDEYHDRKGSESIRPDSFKVSQVYAIIVLPNGGPDLETYTFSNTSRRSWRQACSLFWQVAKALAHAERLVSFEHRDLHWGQVLVRTVPTNILKDLKVNHKSKSSRLYMDDQVHGVQATIIDLGLSRMDAGDGDSEADVHWTPFDDEVFMGEGDYQFEVYRMMKYATNSQWKDFHPTTNILWLHYLLQKIICSKNIKPPSLSRKTKTAPKTEPLLPADASFSEKDCYDCLIFLENWLGSSIAEVVPTFGRTFVKGQDKRRVLPLVNVNLVAPLRAGEVVAYGVKKSWIKQF